MTSHYSLTVFAFLAFVIASVSAQGKGQGGGQETAIPPVASFMHLIGSTGEGSALFKKHIFLPMQFNFS